MKKLKKLLIFVLCLMLVEVPAIAGGTAQTVKAAETVKSGLKKEGSKYRYYVNGEKVKNTWKKVTKTSKGKKTTYYYYFDKNGNAYTAKSVRGYTKNIVLKKINGKWYGFDKYGRRVTGAAAKIDVVKDEYGVDKTKVTLYYFNSNGTRNDSKTNSLRKAAKVYSGSAVTKKYTSAAQLRSLLGKGVKTMKTTGCIFSVGDPMEVVTYANLEVQYVKKPGSSKWLVFSVDAR